MTTKQAVSLILAMAMVFAENSVLIAAPLTVTNEPALTAYISSQWQYLTHFEPTDDKPTKHEFTASTDGYYAIGAFSPANINETGGFSMGTVYLKANDKLAIDLTYDSTQVQEMGLSVGFDESVGGSEYNISANSDLQQLKENAFAAKYIGDGIGRSSYGVLGVSSIPVPGCVVIESYSPLTKASTYATPPADGTKVTIGDFDYSYNRSIDVEHKWYASPNQNGWGVKPRSKTKTSYGPIESYVQGFPVTSMKYTFSGTSVKISPEIPPTVTNLESTYERCSLTVMPKIPEGVLNMEYTFNSSSGLVTPADIPKSVTSLRGTFYGCKNLAGEMTILASPAEIGWVFRTAAQTNEVILNYGSDNESVIDQIIAEDTSKAKLVKGKSTMPANGTSVTIGDYEYRFNSYWNGSSWIISPSQLGWGVKATTNTKTTYGSIESKVQDYPVVNMSSAFRGCTNLVTAPSIPSTVNNLDYAFADCAKLTGAMNIYINPVSYTGCFSGTSTNVTVPLIVYFSGNESTVDRIIATKSTGSKIYKYETVPPVFTIANSPSGWTNGSVTLTVSAADAGSALHGTAYSFDNGSTWQSGNTKIFANNGTVSVKVRDIIGNVSAANNVNISNIDKTVPTISSVTGNSAAFTKGNITLSVTASDVGGGLHKTAYSFDEGVTWQNTNTKTFTTNQTVKIMVRDVFENKSVIWTETISTIDKTIPIISAVTGNSSGFTNNDITLSVSATDAVSGLHSTAYSFDGGVTWQGANSKTFAANQSVRITARDKLENESILWIEEITKIDKSAPSVPTITKTPLIEWSEQDVVIVINGSTDAQSGILRYEYKLGTGAWQTYTAPITLTSTQTVTARAVNGAGGISTETVTTAQIDKIVPTISVVTGNAISWQSEAVTLNVNATFGSSGAHALAYSFDDGETWQSANTKTFSANKTVKIKVRSKAGKVSSVNTVKINRIDTVIPMLPTITKTPSDEWSNKNVSINIGGSTDSDSGIAKYEYKIDSGTWQTYSDVFSLGTSCTVTARAVDMAGNLSGETTAVIKIDRTNPTAMHSILPSEWTNDSVEILINASDDLSGVNSVTLPGGTE